MRFVGILFLAMLAISGCSQTSGTPKPAQNELVGKVSLSAWQLLL